MTILPPPAQRRRHDFTLTMINIVFLLLLFFLTTGSLTNRDEAQSGVPVTSDLPLERLPRPLLLLQTDGTLALDGHRVTIETAGAAARQALAAIGKPDAALNLLADPSIPASTLLTLAERLRSDGLPIQLVTVRRAAKGPGAGG
ncbi:MAG: biopolymer transporter ExbD [Rhizobiaceae bacterium]|nr:biopolymer transporter ExbD [Rhizobiaceae bacterium]